jgi:multidrug efflux pump subunit AcrB
LGVTADQVVAAVSSENQDLPVGSVRSVQQDRVVQVQARMKRPEDFGNIIVARKGGSYRALVASGHESMTAPKNWKTWRFTTANARCCCR